MRQDIVTLYARRTKPAGYILLVASITISAHPLEAINNISVGGQVGVFPQLLRLS